jgi:hypothetical protein
MQFMSLFEPKLEADGSTRRAALGQNLHIDYRSEQYYAVHEPVEPELEAALHLDRTYTLIIVQKPLMQFMSLHLDRTYTFLSIRCISKNKNDYATHFLHLKVKSCM